jgi:hypothetical protein
MRTPFTSSYILPGIVLNPLIVLHGFNTYASHYIPSAIPTVASSSRYKWFEDYGPQGNQIPYFYVHGNDSLCWSYTAVMVVVQVLAYIKIVDDREAQRQIHLRTKAESDKRQRISNGTDREALSFAAKIRCIPNEDVPADGRMSRDERHENVPVESNYLSSTANSTGESRICLDQDPTAMDGG